MSRKKARLIILRLLIAVICIVMTAGCAASGAKVDSIDDAGAKAAVDEKKPVKAVEIRHMNAYTAGSPSYDLFTKLIEDFNNANPDIKVVNDVLPTKDLRTKITVEMAAGTPPELSWSPMSYAREFAKDNKIIDWRPVFDDPANPEYKEWYEEKSLNFAKDKDGRIIMAPFEASIDGLFYNVELFEKNGWEPPKTFDDFLDLAKKCREKGIYATVTGGKDGRFAWLASTLLARAAGMENAEALAIGDAITKWDDPQYGFVDAMKKFKQLIDAEAYPPGLLGISATEADQMFARGEVATYYEGQWKPGNWIAAGGDEFIKKVRRVDFPAMTDMPNGNTEVCTGGNLVGLIIANNLPEDKFKASIKWSKEFVSPKFHVAMMEAGANVFAGKAGYDKSKVPECFNQLIEAYRKAPGYIMSMDTFAPPSIDLAIKQTAMPGLVSGEYTVEQAVAEVQKAAMDYVKAQEK